MAQKTFLEICQRTARECGVHHTATQLPTTVVGQTGELLRIVDWVAEAWFHLQNLHDNWRFQRLTASFATILGQAEYTTAQCGITAGTFQNWLKGTFRSYLTSAGFPSEMYLDDLPYPVWRDTYQFGTFRTTTSRPTAVTVLPNDGLGLGLPPLDGYTILGDYFRQPVRMTVDSDIPSLPEKHSYMLIVYGAMKEYGLYEPAPEVFARATAKYDELLRILERDQLPEPVLAGCWR